MADKPIKTFVRAGNDPEPDHVFDLHDVFAVVPCPECGGTTRVGVRSSRCIYCGTLLHIQVHVTLWKEQKYEDDF